MVIKNISRLVTMEAGPGREGALGVIRDAAVRIRGGRIVWAGQVGELPSVESHERVLDACGGVVMPGLVDCHTHLIHGGFRQNEFEERSRGKAYREIAAAGGGIMSTVRSTRAATRGELFVSAFARMEEAVSFGTTTIEIKTGYGLDVETEAKMADVIGDLKEKASIDIFGTFLGAHVVPSEYRDCRNEYVKLVIDKMLPSAAGSGVINACDVFVEDGAFTSAEARSIAEAAANHGLAMRLHVDQFADGGGGNLAVELKAISADHLDHTSEEGMRAMADAGVTAVLLPGASFFAGRGKYLDAKKMTGEGLEVAVATDYNPGTNPSLNLWMAATIAVTQMGFSCDEALLAITKKAANALGVSDRGAIVPGNHADIIVLDAADEYFPLYRYGVNFVRMVIVKGRVVKGGI